MVKANFAIWRKHLLKLKHHLHKGGIQGGKSTVGGGGDAVFIIFKIVESGFVLCKSYNLICSESGDVLRAYCNFESKQMISITLFGLRYALRATRNFL